MTRRFLTKSDEASVAHFRRGASHLWARGAFSPAVLSGSSFPSETLSDVQRHFPMERGCHLAADVQWGGGGGRCAAKHPPPSGDQDSPQQRGTRPTSQQCRGPETVLDSNLSPTAPCCSVRPATHQTGRTPHSLDGGRVPSPGHGRAERRIWPPGTCRLLTSTRTEVVGAWEAEGGGGRWREKQN